MSNTNNLVHSAVNCMFKFFPSGKIRKLIRIEDIPKLECNFILFLLLEAATEVLLKVRLRNLNLGAFLWIFVLATFE